jgi:hypothetical protein
MSVHEQRDIMSKVYNIYNCYNGVSFRSKKPSLLFFFSCENLSKTKRLDMPVYCVPKSIRKYAIVSE